MIGFFMPPGEPGGIFLLFSVCKPYDIAHAV